MGKKVITCPYCYHKFNNTDVEYQCENTETYLKDEIVSVPDDESETGEVSRTIKVRAEKCPKEVDRRFNDHWGQEVESKHFFKGKPFSLFGSEPKASKCDKCGKPSLRFVCPHCHNWLPTEMIAEGSEIISIVGAPNSGKTVYFFNLMRQLEKKGYLLGLTATPKDEGVEGKKTSEINKIMVTTMYTNHSLPPKTPVLTDGEKPVPLIFKISNKLAGRKSGKTIYIVFYDTPGEAFENTEEIQKMAEHVTNSAGVLLLIDPFNIEKLKKVLQAATGEDVTMGEDSTNDIVLNSLLGKVDLKQASDKPIAVVFSKIDVVMKGLAATGAEELQGIVDMSKNSSFLKTKKLSLDEIDMISGAMEAVSDNWDVGDMKAKIREKYKAENIRMFAVSSLGCQPEGGYIEDINPYRVMDPLVWILYKMGFDIPVE